MPYDSAYTIIKKEIWSNGHTKYVLWDDGEEVYYDQNNRFHRTDGPAIKYPNGTEEFFLHGIKVNSLEELIIKNIIE